MRALALARLDRKAEARAAFDALVEGRADPGRPGSTTGRSSPTRATGRPRRAPSTIARRSGPRQPRGLPGAPPRGASAPATPCASRGPRPPCGASDRLHPEPRVDSAPRTGLTSGRKTREPAHENATPARLRRRRAGSRGAGGAGARGRGALPRRRRDRARLRPRRATHPRRGLRPLPRFRHPAGAASPRHPRAAS